MIAIIGSCIGHETKHDFIQLHQFTKCIDGIAVVEVEWPKTATLQLDILRVSMESQL